MNWVDLTLLLIFLFALWAGYYRGFLLGTLDLLTWTASLVVAYIYYSHMVAFIERFFDWGIWLQPGAFLVTMILARIIFGLIARLILRRVPDRDHESAANKFLGMIPGAINGWIACIIVSALLLALPLRDSINTETRDSKWAAELAMQSEWVNKKLAPVFDQAVRHTMNSLTVHPESDETVQLGFTYQKPVTRPFLEEQMLEMVNKERLKAGLKPLVADPLLTKVARLHSRDMFARGYFAHMNPDGKDPFDRMRAQKVKFTAAGENLALAQTLEIAHTNLMNSPGHRANIMSPDYGRLGIGILDGGFYGLMISQEFRNPEKR
ncbi:MAG: CvpA family protein [Chitinophagaceae bacterium]